MTYRSHSTLPLRWPHRAWIPVHEPVGHTLRSCPQHKSSRTEINPQQEYNYSAHKEGKIHIALPFPDPSWGPHLNCHKPAAHGLPSPPLTAKLPTLSCVDLLASCLIPHWVPPCMWLVPLPHLCPPPGSGDFPNHRSKTAQYLSAPTENRCQVHGEGGYALAVQSCSLHI